jgi:hypothetical protein
MGEEWFEPALNTHTPLSPTLTPFLFALLQLSRGEKKNPEAEKIIEGHFLPLPQNLHLCLEIYIT